MKKFHKLVSLAIIANLFGCVGYKTNNPNLSNTNNSQNQSVNTMIQNGKLTNNTSGFDNIFIQRVNASFPLIYTKINNGGGFICTGSLINSNTVLTAAHCVMDNAKKSKNDLYTAKNLFNVNNMMVIFSKDLNYPVNLNDQDIKEKINIYAVSKIYMNKNAFRGAQVNDNGFQIINSNDLNDVAIIQLSKNVDPNKYVPVSLATVNPTINSEIYIAGYGVARYDDGFENNDTTNKKTNGYYDSAVLRVAKSVINNVGLTDIKVGGSVNGYYTKICSGDSGGPDFIYDKSTNKITLLGVHSYGSGANCGDALTNITRDHYKSPNTSMSVANYYPWITTEYLNNSITNNP